MAIGRNEGERLGRCLASLAGRVRALVYVDSGSTDGSAALAREMGCEVLELDLATPFTAARARNAGLERLRRAAGGGLRFVQFIDGDCELVDGWIEAACARLEARPELAVVCGRRRERRPERSVYDQLCDLEWDTPVGEARACGGDAMMRIDALVSVGGFDPSLIAGEEPELCVRLRAHGFGIERIDRDMTLHEAGIRRFSEWWARARRAGHAYAEGAHLHGAPPERHFVSQTRRAVLLGGVLPAVALGAAPPTLGLSLGLFLGWSLSAAHVYRYSRARRRPRDAAALEALFTTLAKVPEAQGVLDFHVGRMRGRPRPLIEYK